MVNTVVVTRNAIPLLDHEEKRIGGTLSAHTGKSDVEKAERRKSHKGNRSKGAQKPNPTPEKMKIEVILQ